MAGSSRWNWHPTERPNESRLATTNLFLLRYQMGSIEAALCPPFVRLKYPLIMFAPPVTQSSDMSDFEGAHKVPTDPGYNEVDHTVT
eukprot:scaffold15140_cov164-Cylindrotheca_fusiformis.AAC.2